MIGVELLNVLHRLLLTRDSNQSQKLVLSIVKNILISSKESLLLPPAKENTQEEAAEGGNV